MSDNTSGPALEGAPSMAAHAALFDAVAARKTRDHHKVALDASRQPPARRASFLWFDAWLQDRDLTDKTALDLGCGRGEVSVQLAQLGARVTGVDVSAESLSRAENLARIHDVSDRVALREGDAESLPFEDDGFDIVVSAGVMSFVEFDKAAAELARVVRPDGCVAILDTLGHNPIARMGRKRRLVHGETTKFQVENILTCDHIDRLRAHFGHVEVHTFDFLAVPMMFVEDRLIRIHPGLGRIFSPLSALLRAADRLVLKWAPLRRYAFRVVVIARWPRAHRND